ncbi:hypothetical protein SAMN06264364_12177 [Quadrisphaera granulorum]|uniref:Acetyltransferase (GNAT) family protein n=1 Tax=Quadrisphaera granulorum TaxID=317664 RepID=A0A316A2K5_9ACTN|nr:hypothetical protein BXY45_12177 [Quadrisphaera granulorum]SZE97850.1 hypothetical protein SAMN06264364_12177 [Quadrisphaera granulorum]
MAYYGDRQAAGHGPLAFAVRHPARTAAALAAVLRLPRLRADLPARGPGCGEAETDAVRAALLSRSFGVPMACTGVSVLPVPADPEDVVAGRAKQTLRRKIRAAQRRGTTTRLVTDPGEREALLELARRCERKHPDEVYRTAEPEVEDLPGYALWMVAQDSRGTPLLLAVIPASGQWAVLRYFRTLGFDPEHSDSRYLATADLARELAARGVRHLADTSHPAALTPGLRHFQRMLGFRLHRVTVRRVG